MVDNANAADQLRDQQTEDDRRADPQAGGPSAPTGGPVVPRVPPPPGSGRIPAPDTRAGRASDAAPRRAGVGKALRRLFTLLLIVLTGLAIGVLLWIVVPPVFDRVIDPLAENNAAVARLQTQMDVFRAEQTAALTEQRAAVVAAEEASTRRFAEAEQRVAAAEARLRDAEDTISAQGERIGQLETLLAETTTQLDAAAAQLETLQAELPGAEEFADFNYQLMLVRAWQDVLKARLRLFENNAGLAEEDLVRAIDTLSSVYAGATPAQRRSLDPVLDRMDAALVAIQETPFTANSDLEVAWYALGELIQPVAVAPDPPAPPAGAEPDGAGDAAPDADAEPDGESDGEGEEAPPPDTEPTPLPEG